jgi:glutathione S-transferase
MQILFRFAYEICVNVCWEFRDRDGGTKDHLGDADYLWQVYVAAKPDYSGRVTVPVLWDKKTGTVVSNESAEIIRMFNSAFNAIAKPAPDYYPAALREEIDDINEVVYHKVNNGVYKAGFATTQDAYKEHVTELFDALDMLDERLRHNRYLTGDTLTEADWRLFTTLVRFDPVYVGHFKCNIRASWLDPIAGLEDPPNDTEAGDQEERDHAQRECQRDIRQPEERPAEPGDQVDHRVQQRHGLPGRRQHRDRVEGAAKEHERRDDQERHELQLLEIVGPDAQDEAQQREADTGQHQKQQHHQRRLDPHLHEQGRGRQDDHADGKGLGRGGSDIADHDLDEGDRRREMFVDRADELRKVDAERGVRDRLGHHAQHDQPRHDEGAVADPSTASIREPMAAPNTTK